MELALTSYLIPLFVSTVVALVISGLRTIHIHRRCTKLEYLVGDIEDRLNTVRGKEAAKSRWDMKKWEKDALAHEHREPVQPKRYDNDPVA